MSALLDRSQRHRTERPGKALAALSTPHGWLLVQRSLRHRHRSSRQSIRKQTRSTEPVTRLSALTPPARVGEPGPPVSLTALWSLPAPTCLPADDGDFVPLSCSAVVSLARSVFVLQLCRVVGRAVEACPVFLLRWVFGVVYGRAVRISARSSQRRD